MERNRAYLATFAACMAIALALWIGTGIFLAQLHRSVEEDASVRRQNLARSLAEHQASSVRAIDLSLDGVERYFSYRKLVDYGIAVLVGHSVSAVMAPYAKQSNYVLALVVDGKTNREIGVELGLSEKTVRNYLSNPFQKVGVSRRSQAAVMLVRDELGLDDSPG